MKSMKYSRTVLLFGTAVLFLLLNGCSQQADTAGYDAEIKKLIIAVSILPEQTFVEAVAGDLAEVVVMIPAGYNPENYEPTPQEMTSLSNAVLYFAIGVPTEETNILPDIHDLNPDIQVINLPSAVAAVYPEREFAPGQRDPHIWLSPKRSEVIVDTIADELCSIDPINTDIYRGNAENYITKLKELDDNIKNTLASLEQKSFIVYHPSLGYFADDYNLEMLAIEAEGKEATARHIQEIINIANQKEIKVIFYQASISSKQADAIAEDIGGYTEQIDPLAADYIDNLQQIADTFTRIM